MSNNTANSTGPTVSASVLQGYVETAISMGVSREEIAESTKLDFDQLADPDGRIPLAASLTSRQVFERHFGPAFGLKIMEKMAAQKLSVVGYLMANSRTLGEAYQHLSSYRKIVAEVAAPSLELRGEQAVFGCTYPENQILANPSVAEGFVGFWLIRGRYFTGVDWNPAAVHLQGNETDPDVYERIFRAPVVNRASETALIFDKQLLDLPIRNPDSNLARYLQPIAEEVLKNLPGNQSFVHEVQEKILQTLDKGTITLESVAAEFHTSARTLQRRLETEGATFAEVLDNTRRLAAIEYIKDKRLALTETAFLLGFSEPSTFYRAFKRWTGDTPANYRKLLLAS